MLCGPAVDKPTLNYAPCPGSYSAWGALCQMPLVLGHLRLCILTPWPPPQVLLHLLPAPPPWEAPSFLHIPAVQHVSIPHALCAPLLWVYLHLFPWGTHNVGTSFPPTSKQM